jgi:hypothetical protein
MRSFVYIIILLMFLACNQQRPEDKTFAAAKENISYPGKLIADTIIYDVVIRNSNPDDSWTEHCLKNLKRAEFIDSLFALVYDGKIVAYDFDTHHPLDKKAIKRIESQKDYARDKIGKAQFTEKWYFDAHNLIMSKEILSVVLGYEVYNESGELRGYKPLFLLKFNGK